MGRSGRSGGGGGSSSTSSSRSSGSSSGRSFSGGMSSSGRSGRSSSSFSGSSRLYSRPSSGGYYGGGGLHYGGSSFGRGYNRGIRPLGCFTTVIVAFILIMLLGMILMLAGDVQSPKYRTLVEREPLPLSMSKEVSYYTDTLGWIKSPYTLERGMREFYKQTGVQPHLYIIDNMDGNRNPNNTVAEKWANEKYDELFTDEAHLLVVFLDNGNDWGHWSVGGTATKTVLDGEAISIIHNYLDRYITSDLDDEDMFSTVFGQSAKSIMTVYKSPWVAIVKLLGMFVLIIVLVITIPKFIKWKKEAKLREQRQAIDILNTPLEKIKQTDEADELAKKYEQQSMFKE